MNHRIIDFFLQENAAWDDLLTRQKSEIPVLEKKLHQLISTKKNIAEQTLASVSHLQSEMYTQEQQMRVLKEELASQQVYLRAKGIQDRSAFDADSLSRQNLLREQIRSLGRTFSEFKSTYLHYVALIP